MILMVSFNCKNKNVKNEIVKDIENVYGKKIDLIDKGITFSTVVKTKDEGLLKRFNSIKEKYMSNSYVTDFVAFKVNY